MTRIYLKILMGAHEMDDPNLDDHHPFACIQHGSDPLTGNFFNFISNFACASSSASSKPGHCQFLHEHTAHSSILRNVTVSLADNQCNITLSLVQALPPFLGCKDLRSILICYFTCNSTCWNVHGCSFMLIVWLVIMHDALLFIPVLQV